ncbi:predicted protein [Nematostella vectensis]|uniref:Alpha-ketoglutarate-dependent dioxygenase alkB homolog 3 n=1 Tax=Nematostella vectensis TaxID=45351 RepID=A7SAR6_NEMVE|nr:alpha-ketoglutarate-dependent dioxygenase alkB homolog 3 [Nematostella vectensis]EDO39194.1 predicted protein [Nematostella vectensis]|eukprot:XP_001631257.1 predicted protein [Nematostella vectensis]
MDKRRKKRIQGSWAGKMAKPSNKTATSQEEQASGSNDPSEKKFVFQGNVVNTIRQAPPVKTLTERGTYEISTGPSGLAIIDLYPSFLDGDETEWMFEQLQAEIPWEEKDIKIKGEFHKQPRLTAWFGEFPYTYSGLTLRPFQWSPILNILREKIAKATGETFNSMLANLYRHNKDSVDWHADDEPSLGVNPTIASLSFGDSRVFELRKNPLNEGDDYSLMQHIKVPLNCGSLLVMRGSVQEDWQHRVPKEYHDRGPRINLTFRNISPVK